MLEAKAAEIAGTGTVFVHDLLVLTNDFLSDKNRADEERSKGGGGGPDGQESLFQKMLTEEQRQRDRRVGNKEPACCRDNVCCMQEAPGCRELKPAVGGTTIIRVRVGCTGVK